MTTLQSFMLSVCFGAVVGTMLGCWYCIIKDWLHERKEKKRKQKEESEQVSEQ